MEGLSRGKNPTAPTLKHLTVSYIVAQDQSLGEMKVRPVLKHVLPTASEATDGLT